MYVLAISKEFMITPLPPSFLSVFSCQLLSSSLPPNPARPLCCHPHALPPQQPSPRFGRAPLARCQLLLMCVQSFKTIDEAHEAKGVHRRGALLAQIDLYSSLVCCADPASAADAIASVADTSLQLMQQFIARFSALSSCALDLSPYLQRLTPQLLRQLLQQLALLPHHTLASTEDLHSYDSPSQLSRRCTAVCSVNRIAAMAQSLLQSATAFELCMPRLLEVNICKLEPSI